MISHHFSTDIPLAGRPQQRSPPSDQSMSTPTPPQQPSRASPASTALVMSSNNIAGQSASRQLTPNESSDGGTGSSRNSNPQASQPPNPMMRQFARHTKSMSAGVVVPVPGESNNLANALGMHQNNVINNNLVSHHANVYRTHAVPIDLNNNLNQHSRHSHQLQVVKSNPPNQHHSPYMQHNSGQQQYNNIHHHHHHQSSNLQIGSSHNFISNNNNNGRQAISSSVVLNSNGNLHNRSVSTHLSNVMLGSQNMMHSQGNQQVPAPRNFQPIENSIWSIGDALSKSHGKLSGSDYMPQSYIFNQSVADMSCDNVSNGLPEANQWPANGTSPAVRSPEFLPICDLLFNLISMILYFCENTFSIIALIALYCHSSNKYWSLLGASFVFATNCVCQYISFKWLFRSKLEECRRKREAQEELEDEEKCKRRYYSRMASDMKKQTCGSCGWVPDTATEVHLKFFGSILIDALCHILCLGFLIRYIRLVIPVKDCSKVKREARDLCMLRMIQGFCQSAPLLLLQAYAIASQTSAASITSLSCTSAILSLLSICWALASFTKYARKKYMHKFVLTWFGILSQLLWRLGTVSSRVVALTIYAVYYGYWMLVVLFLHWTTMFLWLIKPGNLFKDEVNVPKTKKVGFAMASAWIYCFCYLNFEEHNSKLKMISYYLIQFLENNLLLTVCLIFSTQVSWFKNLSILVVYLGFVLGMLFMFVYYKYFHVSVLNNDFSCSGESIDSLADHLSPAGKKIAGFKAGTLRLKSEDGLMPSHRFNKNIHTTLNTRSQPDITRAFKQHYVAGPPPQLPPTGVFNCRFNPAFKKRKEVHNPHIRQHVT